MNHLAIMDTPPLHNRIELSILLEHITLRNHSTLAGYGEFEYDAITKWLTEQDWGTPYIEHEPMLVNGWVNYHGCMAVVNAIKHVHLGPLLVTDVLNVFYGRQAVYQMLNTCQAQVNGIEGSGVFAGMEFEPNGTEPFYFPNGVRGISTLYLAEVSKELFNQGMLSGKNKARNHKAITEKARKFMEEELGQNFGRVLEHSYYDTSEGTYYADKHRPKAPHIWMSPDLCLALAATDHKSVQMQVIDDLNRLNEVVNSFTENRLRSPSLQRYLPGTIEQQYHEKGMLEVTDARGMGFIPMATVKKLWTNQHPGTTFEVFDKVYPWKSLYSELQGLSAHKGITEAYTASHVDSGSTKLFHIDVLSEYFNELDFSSV